MEIVAMDMKLRGMYIARQLSFHGVSFKIDDVPLTDKFKKAYDNSVELVGTFYLVSLLFRESLMIAIDFVVGGSYAKIHRSS